MYLFSQRCYSPSNVIRTSPALVTLCEAGFTDSPPLYGDWSQSTDKYTWVPLRAVGLLWKKLESIFARQTFFKSAAPSSDQENFDFLFFCRLVQSTFMSRKRGWRAATPSSQFTENVSQMDQTALKCSQRDTGEGVLAFLLYLNVPLKATLKHSWANKWRGVNALVRVTSSSKRCSVNGKRHGILWLLVSKSHSFTCIKPDSDLIIHSSLDWYQLTNGDDDNVVGDWRWQLDRRSGRHLVAPCSLEMRRQPTYLTWYALVTGTWT